MPSAEAVALTAEHRRGLALLATAVVRRVATTARGADADALADIDGWWDRAEATVLADVTRGHDLAASLEGRYLRRHAAIEAVRVEPVLAAVAAEQLRTSLRVSGPVAFKRHMSLSADPFVSRSTMAATLSGAAQRLTLAGSRGTAMETFRRSGATVGYRRITSGRPCPFCSMLASRGAVYSKQTVEFHAHDSCKCSSEPLYRHEPEPAAVTTLRAQWDQATADVSGLEKLAAWRRHVTAGEG